MTKDNTSMITKRVSEAHFGMTYLKSGIEALKKGNSQVALEFLEQAQRELAKSEAYLAFLNAATTYSERNWEELFKDSIEKQP